MHSNDPITAVLILWCVLTCSCYGPIEECLFIKTFPSVNRSHHNFYFILFYLFYSDTSTLYLLFIL
ncbi:hypothetical protein BDF14DRAFT_1824557 [Spinellus fusiger]|nr:hypothetical protein BDF14DRAFT_1824557 [Spinellus fusiger]